jgi:hypothetical protein
MAVELKSMERDDDDKLDAVAMYPMVEPHFPPNLRIALTQHEFKRLECDPSVAVKDAIVEGRFKGRIKSVYFPEQEDACRIEIQIEELGFECEDEETEAAEEKE